MDTRQQHGFTLWELLITLLVAGILFGIGIPNVLQFQRNGAMAAAANDLVTATLMARTEAVKRQVPVTLCLSTNPTALNPTCAPNAVVDAGPPGPNPPMGYIVWVDENNNLDANGGHILTDPTDGNAVVDGGEAILTRVAPPGGTIRMSTNCGYVAFMPSGFTQNVGALCSGPPVVGARVLLFCDDRGRGVAAGNLSGARAVRIDRPGRAHVFQEIGDVGSFVTGTLNPVLNPDPTCPVL